MTNEPFRYTAFEAFEAINFNRLTVEDYAKSLLQRIKERDDAVKAWAYLNPEQVLEQARALDKTPREWRGPLHGVAVGVKDIIYTKDMPTQFGSPAYKNDAPALDGAAVIMLRKAGALILGKTTTTEFAAVTTGTATHNSHSATRTPGGSSSGSAAAVADFQVPIALGTQTAGSVIRPASFNGVYGFKPTFGAISKEGNKVYSQTFDTLGFFARSVEDLSLLGSVFGLKDDVLPRSMDEGVKGARIAFLKTMLWDQHAGPGTRKAFENGREQLQVAGADVNDVELPADFAKLPEWHTCVLYYEGKSAFRPEYLKNKDDLAPLLRQHVEGKWGYSHKDYLNALDGITALRPRWEAIADQYDVVVVPSIPDEAPEGLESTGDPVFNSLWTALHVPVINIPAFKGEHGMPVGLSLTAARFKDLHLLSIAEEVAKVWMRDRE